jgi:hypothetical protein
MTSSQHIIVGFNAPNNITITGGKTIDITQFRSIVNPIKSVNYTSMKTEQQILNYLDSIKDGTNAAILQQLNMYPLSWQNGNIPSFPNDLHMYEDNIKSVLQPYITNITWTKLHKKQALNPPLPIKNIFRDCGIGADVFIAPGFTLFSTIATYIDPALRSAPDEVWPSAKNSISFTKDFMDLFGFEDSSLTSKTVNKNRFNYDIITNGIHYNNNGITPDQNLNLFSGNTNKKKSLKGSGTPKQEKMALISLKEWGDKMQVIMLFIWANMNANKDKTYTMITCDKVVYTLCLLLSVRCIFTGQITEGTSRKYSIEIYEPSEDPVKDAIKRCNQTIKDIITENESFISMIKLLQQNPKQSIYIDGLTDPITIKKQFYTNVYEDISIIQSNLKRIPKLTRVGIVSTDIPTIEGYTKQIQQKYLLIHFIKKIRGNIKLLRSTNYTYSRKKKPAFDHSVDSFYDIIQKSYKRIKRTIGGTKLITPSKPIVKTTSRSPIGKFPIPVKKSVINIPEKSVINIPDVIDSSVFENSGFDYNPIEYTYYENKTVDIEVNPDDQLINSYREEKTIDLNDMLLGQVRKILIDNNYLKFFDSIYSMVLVYAYLNQGIPMDYVNNAQHPPSELKTIVANIISYDLSLPTPFTIPPFTQPIGQMSMTTPSNPILVGVGGKKRQTKKRQTKKRQTKKRQTKKQRHVRRTKTKISKRKKQK